jgi:hypothetical protein
MTPVSIAGAKAFSSAETRCTCRWTISREENGLQIFSLDDGATPVLRAKYPVTDGVEDLSVVGARLALANTLSGVVLFDIRSAGYPAVLDTYPAPFWRFFTKYYG